MKRKKWLSLALSVVMAAGVLTGCGGSSSSDSSQEESASESDESSEETAETVGDLDTSEEVEIVMYVVSDRPAGQDVVDDNLNELLKEKLNCTLKINWIAWSDYSNKYPLLFSSGEKFDLVYASNWLNWTQLAMKGAFMELDDLWPTYAPDNYAATSEEAISEATLDGHIYVIPSQLSTYTAYGPIYRTVFDDGKEYTEEITDFESMETYLDWVAENEPDVEPLDIYSEGSSVDYIWMMSNGYMGVNISSGTGLYFDTQSDNPEIFPIYEYEGVDEFLEMMNRWNEKGFFSKSALADTDSTKTQNGLAAMKIHNLDNYASYYAMHEDWGFKFANVVDPVAHLPYTQDSVAVSNTSENPERALALWNLITTDQEVFDAFYYGVLGTTYELNDEGEYSITDSDLYSTTAMWAARTNEFTRSQVGTPEDYEEYKQEFEEEIEEDNSAERYVAFTIDTTDIETEYSAIKNVNSQYWNPLELGYTDAEEGLVEYKEKMEAAGIDTVIEELQSQLDEYVAGLDE